MAQDIRTVKSFIFKPLYNPVSTVGIICYKNVANEKMVLDIAGLEFDFVANKTFTTESIFVGLSSRTNMTSNEDTKTTKMSIKFEADSVAFTMTGFVCIFTVSNIENKTLIHF
jgi:hypothetical protein